MADTPSNDPRRRRIIIQDDDEELSQVSNPDAVSFLPRHP